MRLHPYRPRVWIGRVATMLALGYTVLAEADAHKAGPCSGPGGESGGGGRVLDVKTVWLRMS